MNNYYPRIRDLREDYDLIQSKVAKMLNMQQSQYCRYRDIPTDILLMLADIYNTTTDYILGRTDKIR